jgi:subfamily B ATP-binding cassette protein MsbA
LASLPYPLLGRYLAPFFTATPASRLIRRSARRHWRLLALNLLTNLVSSVSEGATLGVIFLAVSLIGAESTQAWGNLPIMERLEALPLAGDIISGSMSSNQGRAGLFIVLIGCALLLQLIVAGSAYLNSVSAGLLGSHIQEDVSAMLHRRILSFSFSCASRFRVGDLLNYSGNGGSTVNAEINLTSNLLLNSIQFLVYLGILVAISPWLLLVALAMAMAMAAVQKQVLPRLRHRSVMLTQVDVELGSRKTEQIQALRLLHSSGQLAAAGQQTEGLHHQQRIHTSRLVYVSNLTTPINSLLPIVAIAIIASISIVAFQDRQSGVLPSLVTFVLALQRLNMRLGAITSISSNFVRASASVDRLNAILSDNDKQFVRTGGRPFHQLEHEIRLDAVGLRYRPDLKPALRGIDLVIPRGQTVALVGCSGAGKSSIADLLVGLYDPSEGRILIDGTDLRQLDLPSWQSQLGVVSQDTFLFNASIAANIAYGSEGASRSAIEAAAATAQAAEFISGLPDGYDTMIGERGYRLSGGQRQRLSLARAVLRNPQLLILDEATSALDSQSERLVQEAIERFEQQHTVLVIAHRLSTIVNADQICVLDAGRILERGTHSELVAAGGAYASLWRQQSQQRRTPVATPPYV